MRNLTNTDWTYALQHLSHDERRRVGALLGLAPPKRHTDPRLLRSRAGALAPRRACSLAQLISAPANRGAQMILGERACQPSFSDLQLMWPRWTQDTPPALARICLLVVIEQNYPAAGPATELLMHLDQDISTPSQDSAASVEETCIEFVSTTAPSAIEEPNPREEEATSSEGSAKATASTPQVALHTHPAQVGPPLHATLQVAKNPDSLERPARESSPSISDRLKVVRRQLAPLQLLCGPNGSGDAIDLLKQLAAPPQSNSDIDEWLNSAVPHLLSLLKEVAAGRRPPDGVIDFIGDRISWSVAGLAAAGRLSLEREPAQPIAGGESPQAVDENSPGCKESVDGASPSVSEDPFRALTTLVSQLHLGQAAWAASTFAQGWGNTLEILALAMHISTPFGPFSHLLSSRLNAVTGARHDAEQRVTATSLSLAAMVSPLIAGTDVLAEVTQHLSEADPVRRLALGVLNANRAGVSVYDVTPDSEGPRTRERLAQVRADAAALLEASRTRHFKFHRATRVLRSWMAEDGLLGKALVAVRDDKTEFIGEAQSCCSLFSDAREIDKFIDATDAEVRQPNSTGQIIADPRQRLTESALSALSLVREWASLHSQIMRSPRTQQISDLRQEIIEASSAVTIALQSQALGNSDETYDELSRACCLTVTKRITDLLTIGLDTDRELSVEEVLDARLPYVFEAHITRESWGTLDRSLFVPLVNAALRTPEEAYEGFARIHDHGPYGSARLIAACSSSGTPAIEALTSRRQSDLELARVGIRHQIEEFQYQLDEVEGYPDSITNERLGLVRLQLVDAESHGDDLLSAEELLGQIASSLSIARDHARAEIQRQAQGANISANDYANVARLLSNDEISAAQESLDAAMAGDGVTTVHGRGSIVELQGRFWSESISAALELHSLAPAIAALNQSSPLPPFGPGPSDQSLFGSNANALAAWSKIYDDRSGRSLEKSLPPTLALLSIRGPVAVRTRTIQIHGCYLSLDIEKAAPVAPVMSHQLGSGAGGRYRVHIIWEKVTPEQLLGFVARDGGSGPHLVLYRDVLTLSERVQLARKTREATDDPLIVADRAVALAMAFHPQPTFSILEHLALPFSPLPVFTPNVAGGVPPEIFRGRRDELAEVINPMGSCFVYGGRQVGKSALLRTAARQVESSSDPDRRAVYLDVASHGIGSWKDASEFWPELLDELRRAHVLKERSSRQARADATIRHLQNWLEENPRRRLLLLLDECDSLLDADAKQSFPIVLQLRRLMDRTDRRFKVVLAGLHQVQRFERESNYPLFHFAQQPIQIGPLPRAEAVDLLQGPLLALGYHLDPSATWHLLSRTNYQAGIIQRFGEGLLKSLEPAPDAAKSLPIRIGRELVERAYRQGNLEAELRRRFMLTVDLDKRYRCIAFVIALHNLQHGMISNHDSASLLEECQYWWLRGFENMNRATFAGLVQEMVGLGVLTMDGTRVRIRNPSVVNLLGGRDALETELLEFENIAPDQGFEPSLYRRPISHAKRSPLTEAELTALIEDDRPGIGVVGGSEALGINGVAEAIREKLRGSYDILLHPEAPPQNLVELLTKSGRRTVVISDCRGLSEHDLVEILASLSHEVSRMDRKTSLRRAVLVAGPSALSLWSDSSVAAQSPSGVLQIGLQRLSRNGLEALLVDERLGLGRLDVDAVLRETGGWPILFEQALSFRSNDWVEASRRARRLAAETPFFLDSVFGDLHEVRKAADIIRQLGTIDDWSSLAGFLPPDRSSFLRDALSALRVVDTLPSGCFRIEPLVADALTGAEIRGSLA